jgi:serine/threonine-protein kinase
MSAAPLQPGDLLADKYRVDRVLGHGGMGVVVAARHVELDEWVAIKFLLPDIASDAGVVARFLREAKAAVRIRSEHVVRVSDVGRLPSGLPYMVMEFLDGCDLAELVRRRGPLPFDEASAYLLQACEALAEAHVQGIIHRDLKPQNLFLVHRADGSPCVKVLDFGIAKFTRTDEVASLTKTSAMMGSALYMSPEQLRAPKDVDARTDVWALGVVLFELLTGVKPFDADALPLLVAQILDGAPTKLRTLRPEAPAALEAFLERCLEKDRELRFGSVAALAEALLPFAGGAAQISVDRIAKIMQPDPQSGPPVDSRASGASGAGGASIGVSPLAGTLPVAGLASPPTDGPWRQTGSRDDRAIEPERRRAPRVRVVAIAAALGLAVVGAGLWGRRHPAPGQTALSSASSPSPSPSRSSSSPSATAGEAAATPSAAPRASGAASAPSPAGASPSAAPSSIAPAPGPASSITARGSPAASATRAVPKPSSAPPKPSNCDPPTYVGEDGLQHFKPECK